MYCINANSLTGTNQINTLNLTGKSMTFGSSRKEPYYVTKLKKIIFNRFITPLYTKNWKIIEQNIFSLSDILLKLNKYSKESNCEDLETYSTLLNIIVELLGEHNHFENLEKIFYSDDAIGTIKFKMPKIRMRPEYELYKLIIGKPKKFKDYDDRVLKYIENMLKKEYVEFDVINEAVIKEFNIKNKFL